MLIPAVEDGIERLLRRSLPLTTEQGDVSFDAPSSTWSATVNRLTVNVFLYAIARSSQPPRLQENRRDAHGTLQRRFALPMVQLSYLVSAWAGSTRDEHELLGDVLAHVLANPVIPEDCMPAVLESSVQLSVAVDEVNRPRDVWSSVGGNLKASFTVLATVAADAYSWQDAPPLVERVAPTAVPLPRADRNRS